jgi:hypothetical protein
MRYYSFEQTDSAGNRYVSLFEEGAPTGCGRSIVYGPNGAIMSDIDWTKGQGRGTTNLRGLMTESERHKGAE